MDRLALIDPRAAPDEVASASDDQATRGNGASAHAFEDLVLDTNVVLDWLAFGHPIGAPIEAALTSRQCRWLCTRAMRDELARVVARESLARWAIDAPAVLAVFDSLGVDPGPPAPLGAAERLPCTDPDDQIFIDLAIARRAHALLTRDRAVLRLAPRARRFGVLIATPEVWLRQRAAARPLAWPGAPTAGGASAACGSGIVR